MTTSVLRPNRVLLLIDSFQMGGAERITTALLPHLDRSRVIPIVCTLRSRGDSPLSAQLGDVPRYNLGARRMLDPVAFQKLLRLLRTQHIDLIHAQLQDSTVLAVAAHKLTGIPVVVTRHLIGDDHLGGGANRNWRQRMRNDLEKLSVRSGVARVITVSNATRDNYADLTGLPLSRFRTIYNGIDLDRFEPAADKTSRRQELGLPTDGALVTMVGVLRPGKGHEVAIEAARHLPGAHFLLVGDGEPEYRARLEDQARLLTHRVHFLGQRMDVAAILSASDIFVLPSDSEALPTVLIEAGASALPVVASHVGGVPEIIEDGITGILIPPQDPQALANAVKRLICDPSLVRRMGDQAYQRVHARFTLSSQTRELIDLYESVVNETQERVAS